MSDPHSSNSPGYEKSGVREPKDTAGNAADRLRNEAAGVAETVSGKAAEYADLARESAAEEVGSVAAALRTAADQLRRGSPQERTFSQLADGLADASEAVRDKDLSQMVDGLSSFARRNPAVFLGGAALLGFAATRFSKASERHGNPEGVSYSDPVPHPDPHPAAAPHPEPVPADAHLSRGTPTKPVSGGLS